MATDLERLIVSLEARTASFEKAMNRANGVAQKQGRRIESTFAKMGRNASQQFTALGRAAAAAFAIAGGVSGAKSLVDSATRIENALKVAGLAGKELTAVYDALYLSAQRNSAPIESLVTLYGRAAIVQKELGVSTEELLRFTDNVALSLRVAGTSAQSASGALLQLSQALGSGVVRAEEFNSILEGALPIALAAAAGLKEAGGSVAKLRQLVIEGEVSSEAFFRAFEAGAPMLKEKVADAVLTIDQRLTNLRNALIDAAGRFNKSSEAANTFGEAIDNVADYVNSVNMDALVQQIMSVISAFQQGINWATQFGRAVGESVGKAYGLDDVGKMITGGAAQKSFLGGALTVTSSKALQERIDSAFEGQIQAAGKLTEEAIRKSVIGPAAPKTGRLQGTGGFQPVSLDDFAPPSGDKKKKGGGKAKESEYAREVEQIRERTEALQAETEAMAKINPLIDDYGFAVEKAAAVQDLLNAAKKAGLAITPELSASIDALATGYANASAAAEQLAERQDKVREAAEDVRELGKDVFGGFIADIKSGTSAAEALQNALNKVLDKVLEIGLNAIFSGGGGGGGILGGILGSILPGYASGTHSARAGYALVGERGPEIVRFRGGEEVIPNNQIRRPPASARMARGTTGGTTISISAPINAPGADAVQLARVERSVQDLARSIPKQIDGRIHNKQMRGTRA